MKLFLVCPQDTYVERIEAKIEENFGDYHMKLPNRSFSLWILAASPTTTTVDISETLGMLEEDPSLQNRGIVFEITNYYGRDFAEVWQKLEAWANV